MILERRVRNIDLLDEGDPDDSWVYCGSPRSDPGRFADRYFIGSGPSSASPIVTEPSVDLGPETPCSGCNGIRVGEAGNMCPICNPEPYRASCELCHGTGIAGYSGDEAIVCGRCTGTPRSPSPPRAPLEAITDAAIAVIDTDLMDLRIPDGILQSEQSGAESEDETIATLYRKPPMRVRDRVRTQETGADPPEITNLIHIPSLIDSRRMVCSRALEVKSMIIVNKDVDDLEPEKFCCKCVLGRPSVFPDSTVQHHTFASAARKAKRAAP